ncbi:MAG: rod shape-determining protein MreC [Oscillospiraceae bacterium]|nr:rod shape-determining protein MreC [Oscillospiraceae bacterium]
MKLGDFFRSTRFRVLLCIIAVLVGMMLYSLKQGGQTDFIRNAAQTVSAPVRKFSASISNRVNTVLDTYFESKAYREENDYLRAQIAEQNARLVGMDDTQRELKALRDQLAIKEKSNGFVMSEPCVNLMPLTNDLSGGFIIDQGEKDGILLNSPVICSQGLIGVVTEVGENFSTVTTILSSDLSVGAVVLETGDSGIVEGTLKCAADNKTKMIYLDEDNTVHAGDLVITAGTTGLFPYGLAIGNVTETGMAETGLTAYAELKPSVDFDTLKSVTVLLDFEGKGVSFNEN